jgi:hypothetical protein
VRPILEQAWRGATLDRRAFGEWMFGASATGDAAIVVIGVALVRFLVVVIASGSFGALVLGVITTAINALAGWVFLALATWFAGTKLFDGVGDWQTVLRMHGLAYLPNIVSVLSVVSGPVGNWSIIIGYVWFLIAAVVGTSVGLSLNTRDATLSVLIGAAILYFIETLFNGAFFGISQAISGLF